MISKTNLSKIMNQAPFIGLMFLTFTGCSQDEPVLTPELASSAYASESSVNDLTSKRPTNRNAVEGIEGNIVFLNKPPKSVELGKLVSDSTIFMFAEKQNHRLSRAISTDMSLPGDYFPESVPSDRQTWKALNPGVIPAGTRVSSYYFHYDNETYNENFKLRNYLNCIGQYRVQATVTFKTPVLGIVMRAGVGKRFHLRASDAELGLTGVDYCEHNLRHFPGINIADGCRSDRFILSEDRKTLRLTNNTDVHHDNYRVIVAAK